MKLSVRIALRYLFARKSHNVINVISGISAAGMAIGTAALVIILSVFGGFDSLVRENLRGLESDFEVQTDSGSFFEAPFVLNSLLGAEGIDADISQVARVQSFAVYEESQAVVNLIGVDSTYEYKLDEGGRYYAIIGTGLARNLKLNPRYAGELALYFPSRDAKTLTSQRSLRRIDVIVADTFQMGAGFDDTAVILPLAAVRDLCELAPDEVSAIRINFRNTSEKGLSHMEQRRLRRRLSAVLSDGFVLKDRYEQNASVYKMIKYERLAVYGIMIFVLIIIAFNIFGSLSLLIIDKKQDISTLRAMGADSRTIKHIFVLEGWMISLLGMAIGLAAGIIFCLLQQHFGLIKMPGNYIVSAYPISMSAPEIFSVALIVAVVGYLVALLPVKHYSEILK